MQCCRLQPPQQVLLHWVTLCSLCCIALGNPRLHYPTPHCAAALSLCCQVEDALYSFVEPTPTGTGVSH
jgi:hypothetical protein